MPRKGHTQKRDVLADPMYNSKVVTKLVNSIMLDGKKGVAQKIVYGAFATVEEKTGRPALEVFEEAMNNVMPALEVKARRIGGATYQVPIEVRADRRQALALRWLTTYSRKRGEKTMEERLANEIMTVTDENRKHIEEELNEINKILIKYNGIKHHTPVLEGVKAELLLMTNRLHREVVRRQIPVKDTKLHPLGVLVKTDNIPLIMQVRTFRKMYFTIHAASLLPKDAQEAAGLLAESDMYDILRRMHREGGPFYYRIESTADAAYQSRLAKAIDMHFAGRMINSPNDYDVVIKLIPTKNDNFFVCMRLCSIQDNRFAYRKNVLPTSMHPSQAALIVSLAKPYLKETAQIMDPFCGVGTLLIERAHLVPAREIYATDTYGDAITMGRENAALAKTRINFIHRDFFDFRHDYKFDELITDMPVRNRQTKAEMELFYERFFDKAAEHLVSGGIIVMYSNEIGFVKKQIRLRVEYRLLQETCILDKKDFYLFVIRYED